jgi:hypothetical protein
VPEVQPHQIRVIREVTAAILFLVQLLQSAVVVAEAPLEAVLLLVWEAVVRAVAALAAL